MNDLIYRQSAINALENTECELLSEEWDELTNAIKQVPSAEPKKGSWEHCEDEDGMYDVCSNCGADVDISHYGRSYNYCPHCGAKMEWKNDG